MWAYGEYSMKKSGVFECHRQFKEGWEDVHNDARSGQPKNGQCNSGQSANLNAPRSKIKYANDDRKIEREQETVQLILMANLRMRKISAKMVPRILIEDQKERLQMPSEECRGVW